MSSQQTVYSRGIYHGLPVHDPSIKGLTAIITGANGISGHYMLRVLAQSPERWAKIYCLSRRPPAIPDGLPSNAEHIPLDFLQDADEIAKVLQEKRVSADYVFFYSYVQVPPKDDGGPLWSDASEMCRVNLLLLSNFLSALDMSNITPKRIMLQTGAKNYGIHLGPTLTPQEEHHPRVPLAPNFYYPQEGRLRDYCAAHPHSSWTVVMPSYIVGAVPDAAMNLVHPLGIYASVTAHLHLPLAFPTNLEAWEATHVGSSSMLNAHLEEWAVLAPQAAGQKLNAADSSPFAWGSFWAKMADWYGVECGRPSMEEGDYTAVTTPYDPPPRRFGPPATHHVRFTLTNWARQKHVQRAWAEIIELHGLKNARKLEDMDVDRIFSFADGSLLGGSLDLSMNKARKMGWHGFVDTSESIKEVLKEFGELGMLPPVPK